MKIVHCNKDLVLAHLGEACVISGFPPLEKVEWRDCNENDLKRAAKLAKAPVGSGHDTFLKGIVVTAIIDAPTYWWLQASRYHWFDIISSQSKMYQIRKKKDKRSFEEHLSEYSVDHTLTAGVVTNYLQLKTMYYQRKNHNLVSWKDDFVNWVEDLPLFKQWFASTV